MSDEQAHGSRRTAALLQESRDLRRDIDEAFASGRHGEYRRGDGVDVG